MLSLRSQIAFDVWERQDEATVATAFQLYREEDERMAETDGRE